MVTTLHQFYIFFIPFSFIFAAGNVVNINMCHYTPTCTQMREYMYLFVQIYVRLDGNIETSFPPFL